MKKGETVAKAAVKVAKKANGKRVVSYHIGEANFERMKALPKGDKSELVDCLLTAHFENLPRAGA